MEFKKDGTAGSGGSIREGNQARPSEAKPRPGPSPDPAQDRVRVPPSEPQVSLPSRSHAQDRVQLREPSF